MSEAPWLATHYWPPDDVGVVVGVVGFVFDKNDGVNKRVTEDDELGDATNFATMGNDADSNSETEDYIHSSTDFEFYLQGLERANIIVNKPLPQVTMSSG